MKVVNSMQDFTAFCSLYICMNNKKYHIYEHLQLNQKNAGT